MINLVTELSVLLQKRKVYLSKAYEFISGDKVSTNRRYEINWQALTDEFFKEESGNKRVINNSDLRN